MKTPSAIALAASLIAAPAAFGYEYWEHRFIAEAAASQAFIAFDADLPLPWLDEDGGAWVRWKDGVKGGDLEIWTSADANAQGHWGTTFGHLVGIYADWIADVPTMRERTSPAKLKELRGKERVVFGLVNTATKGSIEFFGAAAVNETHFSKLAVYTYVDHHHRAIKLAFDAAMRKKAGRITEAVATLTEALHHEAIGCHSLTDLFAPGHLVQDRQQAVSWIFGGGLANEAKGVVRGASTDKATHDKFNQAGLYVRSYDAYIANVEKGWLARGDECLTETAQTVPNYGCRKKFEDLTKKLGRPKKWAPANSDGLGMARGAVMRSVLKLLTAYDEALAGRSWEEVHRNFDYYSALSFVPVQFQKAQWVATFGKEPPGCGGAWCSFPHLAAIEDVKAR